MQNVLLIVLLLLALGLVGVVLLQRSEGGGMGLGAGGGGAMGQRGQATALTRLTWIFGAGFMVISLTLTVLAARNAEGTSVVDRLSPPVEAGEAAPIDTDALLPPPVAPAGDVPLVPRAE